MDIVKKKTQSRLPAKWIMVTITMLVAILLLVAAKYSLNRITLNKKDLVIATVNHGDLQITIDGYGKLVSHKQELITALTRATVKEIVLKPGAQVTKGSIIVRLENPELGYQLSSAEQQLAQLKANSRQLHLNQQREILNENAKIAELAASLEAASLKREAEQKLVSQGIVSELTFKESVLDEKQLTTKIDLAKQGLAHLKNVHQEAQLIQQERINQQINTVKNAQDRLDALQVAAKFDGILQRLPVNLGQSLNPGQEIALIGSTKDLIAEIKVPQSQANSIQIGHSVNIDTRQHIIAGKVSRIDPIVKDNTVLIDVQFTEALNANLRPEQNVDAQIITDTLYDTAYIERPANIQSKTQLAMYRVNNDMTSAQRINIKLGKKTSRFVAINHGANRGENLILTDLSNYQAEHITLN